MRERRLKILLTQLDALPDPESSGVLSNARRREILRALRDVGAPLDLADLAADVTGGRRPGGEPDYEAIRRSRLVLYHVDVPTLVDAGVVGFDADRLVVAPAT